MDHIEKMKILVTELDRLLDEAKQDDSSGNEELGDLPYRVVHLNQNPFAIQIQKEELEFDLLRRDNDRLKARLSLIETGNSVDITMRIEEAVNNAQQIEKLKQEVDDYKNREEKISSSLRKTASDFRQACLSLVGFRVDALKNNIYRLTHQHAVREEDKLFFEVKRDGTIVLLKNKYSNRFSDLVTTYIDKGDSIPSFLAAVNLEIFKSQSLDSTQSVDMSMTMSTTILPNPSYSHHR